MKYKLILLIMPYYICSCAQSPFIENYLLNKRFVVASEVNSCKFLDTVRTQSAPNSKEVSGAPIRAVFHLKIQAEKNRLPGNTLNNIHMTERKFPIAQADVYSCPQEIFDKYKPLIADEDYLYKNIKFDLVINNDEKK